MRTAAKRSITEGVEPVPGREPPRSVPPRRASSRPAEGDHREALHHGGRGTGSRMGTAAKRSTTEAVEAIDRRGPPRSPPPRKCSSSRRASSRSSERDCLEALHHGGRRAGPWMGIAAKHSATEGVEPGPERDCREALHHGGRRGDPLNGTAALHRGGFQPVPGRGPPRRASPRRASSRSRKGTAAKRSTTEGV